MVNAACAWIEGAWLQKINNKNKNPPPRMEFSEKLCEKLKIKFVWPYMKAWESLATVALKGNFFFFLCFLATMEAFMLALKKRHFVGSLSTWTPSLARLKGL